MDSRPRTCFVRSAFNLSRSVVVLKTDVVALPSNLGSRTERTTHSDQWLASPHPSVPSRRFIFLQANDASSSRAGQDQPHSGPGGSLQGRERNARRVPQTPFPSAPSACRLPADLPTPISCPSHHATRSDCHMQGVQFHFGPVELIKRLGRRQSLSTSRPTLTLSSPSHLVPAQLFLFFATFQGYYNPQSDPDEVAPGLALRARLLIGTPGALDFVVATRRSLPDHQRGGSNPQSSNLKIYPSIPFEL